MCNKFVRAKYSYKNSMNVKNFIYIRNYKIEQILDCNTRLGYCTILYPTLLDD